MPREDALFTGLYCLLGIPLFRLALGHFALLLVEEHAITLTLTLTRTRTRTRARTRTRTRIRTLTRCSPC